MFIRNLNSNQADARFEARDRRKREKRGKQATCFPRERARKGGKVGGIERHVKIDFDRFSMTEKTIT